jgi:thymidylate synthase
MSKFEITWEHDYLDLLGNIVKYGEPRMDRTGTGTTALFADNIRIDLRDGFPAVTTKKLAWKSMVAELLWFIEGSADERRLAEIQHGTRDSSKKTIWTANAQADYWKPKAQYDGDLGRVYGVQWRHWRKTTVKGYEDYLGHPEDPAHGVTYFNAKVLVEEVDQLKQVIHALKTNHTDRRIILSAWNPAELGQMALPPCHMFAQFYLDNERQLSCQMYQRSVDSFLGLPFNIASYALLTHLIAHVIGADVGILNMVLGDTHIYNDHTDQVLEQLARLPNKAPRLKFNRKVDSIDGFRMEDFELVGYEPQDAIAANMSA